jgi:NADH:ubiquinone reductase (non-electrogenic)
MASKAVARPLASVGAAIGFRRGFATAPRRATSQQPLLLTKRSPTTQAQVQIPRQRIQQAFRRGYAEVSPETQRVVKKKGWRVLKWTWRLTYGGTLAGLGYLGYLIYQNRTPAEQQEPDPSKKTLVVLGMSTNAESLRSGL